MKIRWKEGTRISASASDVYKFFEDIRVRAGGELDVDLAVKESKKKSSPLHNHLEWDDKIASHEYRKIQVKEFIRKIEVIYSETNTPVRAYESIKVEVVDNKSEKPEVKNVYRRTEDILADPASRSELLGQAVRDALAYKKRYSALSELSQIIDSIDNVIDKVAKSL